MVLMFKSLIARFFLHALWNHLHSLVYCYHHVQITDKQWLLAHCDLLLFYWDVAEAKADGGGEHFEKRRLMYVFLLNVLQHKNDAVHSGSVAYLSSNIGCILLTWQHKGVEFHALWKHGSAIIQNGVLSLSHVLFLNCTRLHCLLGVNSLHYSL